MNIQMRISLVLINLLLCFLVNNIEGQTVDQLDAKYGFKNLRFGTPPDLTKCIPKQISELESGPKVTAYDYTDPSFDKVLDISVQNTTLVYYDNKLMTIRISFYDGIFDLEDFNILKNGLSTAYGIPKYEIQEINEGKNACGWRGTKVDIFLMANISSDGTLQGALVVEERSLAQKANLDRF